MSNKLAVSTDVPTEIMMTRTFDAPKHLVYRAMTEPELIKRWLGGVRSKVLSAEVDLRVGGTYKWVFGLPDGNKFWFSGTYQEIGEDRFVHTEAFNDQPGAALVITTLVEEKGRTTMVAIMRFETQEQRDMVVGTGMAEGAGESYDHLDQVLKTL